MTRFFRPTFAILVWLFLVLIPVQFYLAGVGAFKASSFDAHVALGTLMTLISLLVLIAAWPANVGSTMLKLAGALFALMIVQNVLAFFIDSAKWIAALHPVNGLLVIGAAMALGMRCRAYLPFGSFGNAEDNPDTRADRVGARVTS